MQRVKNSYLIGMSSLSTPLRAQKEQVERLTQQRGRPPRKQRLPDTTGLMVAACPGPAQAQATQNPSTERGKGAQSPIPSQEAISIDSCWEWENHRLQWNNTGDMNHTLGQAPCPVVYGHNKMNSMVFLEMFIS